MPTGALEQSQRLSQPAAGRQPSGVTAAVHDAVTRHDQKEPIAGHRVAHRPGGPRRTAGRGQFAIGLRAAIANRAAVLHHAPCKGRQEIEVQLDVAKIVGCTRAYSASRCANDGYQSASRQHRSNCRSTAASAAARVRWPHVTCLTIAPEPTNAIHPKSVAKVAAHKDSSAGNVSVRDTQPVSLGSALLTRGTTGYLIFWRRPTANDATCGTNVACLTARPTVAAGGL